MNQPFVVTFGSGKGGTGKSLLAANVAVCLAQDGLRVGLIDADGMCPNLHTFFGVEPPGDVIMPVLQEKRFLLPEDFTPVGPEGLGLAAGNWLGKERERGAGEGERLARVLRESSADILLVDAPSGVSGWSTALFAGADVGVLPLLPEPTSVENAYAFLRAACRSRLGADAVSEGWPSRFPGVWVGHFARQDARKAQSILKELKDFKVLVMVNQARTDEDRQLAEDFSAACRRFIGLGAEHLGCIEQDERAWMSVKHRRPLVVDYPFSQVSGALRVIADRIASLAKDAVS